jgi:serine/threonine protein kinase
MLKLLYINPTVRAALEGAGVLTERAIVEWDRGERIVRKNWADAFRCAIDGIGTVYVKRYFPQRNRLLGLFRQNLAIREYTCSATLQRLGVPQAEPILAAAVKDCFGLVSCGVYMMREVANAVSLDVLLERMKTSPDRGLLAAIADELVRLLEAMHCGGFCHWDFKPRNLLVSQEGGSVVITPIDSRSGRMMTVFTRRACVRRDYRFLQREPLLRPFLEQPFTSRK